LRKEGRTRNERKMKKRRRKNGKKKKKGLNLYDQKLASPRDKEKRATRPFKGAFISFSVIKNE